MAKKEDANNALTAAIDAGVLSQDSLQVIDLNQAVALGVMGGQDIDDIQATEVTLVSVLIDETGSIHSAGLKQAVMDGQNLLIKSLADSKQKDNILVAQWRLKEIPELIHAYIPVDQAILLDKANYNPRSSTALYDCYAAMLTANVGYAQRLRDAGTPVKSVVVVITDGQDCASVKATTHVCAMMNQDVLKSEQFLVAFVGMAKDRQDEDNFRQIADDMGFPSGAVLTASATASDIRKAFQMVSQSAIRASQKAVTVAAQNSFFTT